MQLLACPRCGGGLGAVDTTAIACGRCITRYPLLDGIPWLYREPALVLGEWRNRLRLYLDEFAADERMLEHDLASGTLAPATSRRLRRLGAAYREQRLAIARLLEPLHFAAESTDGAVMKAFAVEVPRRQDLHSYYTNLHRDWCWGGDENELAVAAVSRRLPTQAGGRLLVLGAGGCRLAYDLHEAGLADRTVALDINPLLLLAARRIMAGNAVDMYEFPIAPRRADDCAVLRNLAAPRAVRAGFSFVFGDAFEAPFPPGSFDAVLTPWLIDIVDRDVGDLARQINRLLRAGGSWINHGSVSFVGRRPADRYGLEELLERVSAHGFSVPEYDEMEMPYMRSPASRHGRVEQVVTFVCRKSGPVPVARSTPLPDWLLDPRVAVPVTAGFETAGLASRIQAFVLALIDGQRTAADLAGMLVERQLLDAESAMAAVRGLLLRLYDEQLRSPPS